MNQDQEFIECKSEIGQISAKFMVDDFTPFSIKPNREQQIQKHFDDSEDNQSFRSQSYKQNIIDDHRNILSKIQNSSKHLDYLKIKNIISRFKSILFKQSQLLSTEQKKSQISFGLKVEKYIQQKNTQSQQLRTNLIFDSNHIALIIFDQLILILILILLLFIPYFWSFQMEESNFKSILIFISFIILAIDAFVKLNTSIIVQGNIISDRFEVLKIRLTHFIFLDAIFIISLFYLNNLNEIIFLIIFFLTGFIKFNYYFDNFIEFFDFPSNYIEIISLIKLTITIVYSAHAIACIWHFIGMTSLGEFQQSWITTKNLENEIPFTRYIYSFYWAIVTMVTVGYGDITPQNKDEIISCTFIMILSCGVYAFSLNKVGQVIQNLNDLSSYKRELMRTVTSHMKSHSISNNLQCRVRNYIEYQIEEQKLQNKIDVQQVINSLSTDLKNEIMFNLFSNLTNKNSILLENFSQNTIKKLANLLKLLVFSPGDTILVQNDPEDQSLFFVDYGVVQLVENTSDTIICEYEKGQYFGEHTFFTEMPSKFGAISKTFSRLYQIKRSDFINILSQEEIEQFKQISQQFLLDLPVRGHNCQFCHQNSHILLKCPIFTYVPQMEKIILKYRITRQERQNFQRKNRNKSSSLLDLDYITQMQKEFLIDMENEQSQNSGEIILSSELGKESKMGVRSSIFYKIENQKNQSSSKQHLPIIDANNSQSSSENVFQRADNVKSNSSLVEHQFPFHSKSNFDMVTLKHLKKSIYKQNLDLQMFDFERMKIYTKFFPQNNVNVVIQEYNLVNKYLRKQTRYRISKFLLFPVLKFDKNTELEQYQKTKRLFYSTKK